MVIEHGRTLLEAASVPRVAKFKTLEVQMMAELMAESTQQHSERGDLPANGRSQPDPDQQRRWVVVSEECDHGVFPDAQRSGGKHPDGAVSSAFADTHASSRVQSVRPGNNNSLYNTHVLLLESASYKQERSELNGNGYQPHALVCDLVLPTRVLSSCIGMRI